MSLVNSEKFVLQTHTMGMISMTADYVCARLLHEVGSLSIQNSCRLHEVGRLSIQNSCERLKCFGTRMVYLWLSISIYFHTYYSSVKTLPMYIFFLFFTNQFFSFSINLQFKQIKENMNNKFIPCSVPSLQAIRLAWVRTA